ncbi:glycoprotease M22 family domain-containing protein [Blattabacterium sp. (Blattella germanica) str. Bge]|uniref:tRNA (adenosine(37)-N6)-threonylcarbamoyltransferase complex dimerization subunit type 1 TsaB n=1 Tax=Blattabacterium sp. (Blattella germanica) TaxID=624186 RepID=UPI0001BB6272|nr:tRNA (adenosine(37)-N6)-threonylcarbamoyltransferase complex dimerization subunit type 1 TsaB [Blattabacterium sp. (Blattella germanica)]ACY40572.1 glycoprotease M22 family domain-containing protein [Blattabacterium sp. (Blattella germanica) str. Bge]
MSLILNLETSTKNCSVSIAKNGICIVYVEECSKKYFHSEKLHTFIQYATEISKIRLKDLKSVCVSKGPGSYTSLRIGLSAAKGLCYSLEIPLLSVDSLTIMSQKINIKSGFLIPMIHAKSDLFYTSLFNKSKKRLSSILIKKIHDDFFTYLTKSEKIYFIGNIDFFGEKLFSNNRFFTKVYPSAMDMSFISYVKFCNKKFDDIEKLTPSYF